MDERVRKVDVEKLSEEQLQNLIQTMSGSLLEELRASEARVNKLLGVYGLKCALTLDISEVVK